MDYAKRYEKGETIGQDEAEGVSGWVKSTKTGEQSRVPSLDREPRERPQEIPMRAEDETGVRRCQRRCLEWFGP